MKQKPTTRQIAFLCAVLSSKSKDRPEKLADKAIDIWRAAEIQIEARYSLTAAVLSRPDLIQKPLVYPRFPVGYDDLVKHVMPKLDTAERAARVRFALGRGDQDAFAKFRAKTYPNADAFLDEAAALKHRLDTTYKAYISASRSQSAKRRWNAPTPMASRS